MTTRSFITLSASRTFLPTTLPISLATVLLAAFLLRPGLSATALTLTIILRARRTFVRRSHGFGRRHKAFNFYPHYVALDEFFDVFQIAHFFAVHQRQGRAAGSGAACAANAVHIIFGHVGQFKIDHLRQLVDIQPARGNVGCHQHADFAALEASQRLGTRALAFVAMNGGSGNIVLDEFLRQLVGAMLGAGKHQNLLPVMMLDEVRQQFSFMYLRYQMHRLLHHFRCGVATRHFHAFWIVQQAIGQRLDLVGESGGEQQVLPLRGQHSQNFLDVADKAHIQHTVGLVQHQNFHSGKINGLLTQMIQQATRRGDQNIHARLQRLELRIDIDPAEHHHGFQRQVFAVGFD